jgi:ADP-heptose:LPS heptosyltransferase
MLLYYRRSFIILSFIISYLLWLPLRILNKLLIARARSFSPPKKILVQDGYLLGDALLYSHALKNLANVFPSSEIHLVTHPTVCGFLAASGWAHTLVPFAAPWQHRQPLFLSLKAFADCVRRLTRERYDMAIDFHGDIRGLAMLFLCGIPRRVSLCDFGGRPFCTDAFATPVEARHQMNRCVYLVQRIAGVSYTPVGRPLWPTVIKETHGPQFATNITRSLALVHPATSNPDRQWPAKRFAEVVDLLAAQNRFDVRIVAGVKDKKIVGEISSLTAGTCPVLFPSFYELEQLLKRAAVIVCLDSFAQHAAAALGTPAVVIYGPSRPVYVAPLEGPVSVVWNNCIIKPPYQVFSGPRSITATTSDTVVRAVAETAR